MLNVGLREAVLGFQHRSRLVYLQSSSLAIWPHMWAAHLHFRARAASATSLTLVESLALHRTRLNRSLVEENWCRSVGSFWASVYSIRNATIEIPRRQLFVEVGSTNRTSVNKTCSIVTVSGPGMSAWDEQLHERTVGSNSKRCVQSH